MGKSRSAWIVVRTPSGARSRSGAPKRSELSGQARILSEARFTPVSRHVQPVILCGTLATVAKVPQPSAPTLRRIDHADFSVLEQLSLSDQAVDLWRIDLEATSRSDLRWRALLSEDELQRAQRFHF